MIQRASTEMRRNLKWVLAGRDDQLDEWLAGPEADRPAYTDAYIAFAAMRMAFDEITLTAS
jgi:hypothetical protein